MAKAQKRRVSELRHTLAGAKLVEAWMKASGFTETVVKPTSVSGRFSVRGWATTRQIAEFLRFKQASAEHDAQIDKAWRMLGNCNLLTDHETKRIIARIAKRNAKWA